MATDIESLQAYREQNDARAFVTLVSRYAGLVYGSAFRITGNAQDAEDITQEAFLKLADGRNGIPHSLPAWLHTVAVNLALDRVRVEDRRKHHEEAAAAVRPTSDKGDTPVWQDLAPHLDNALKNLPDDLRDLLLRHFLQGYSQVEIAKTLGVNQSTVSRHIDKGIALLRKEFKRKGILVSSAVLAVLLSANAAQAAPTAVVAGLCKLTLMGANAGMSSAAGGVASATTATGAAGGTATAGGIGIMKLGLIGLAAAMVVTVGVIAQRSERTEVVPPPAMNQQVVSEIPEADTTTADDTHMKNDGDSDTDKFRLFDGASSLPWHLPEWEYRQVVEVKRFGPKLWGNTILVEFDAAPPLLAEDGRDVRVVDENGRPVPSQWVDDQDKAETDPFGEGKRPLLNLEMTDPEINTYIIYFGNPEAQAETHEWKKVVPALMLETRVYPGGLVPTTWREMTALIARSNWKYGEGRSRQINDSENPFGPSENYIGIYRGMLNCPVAGEYGFATDSDDASFLLIDGMPVTQWPGNHSSSGQFDHYGTVKLTAAPHRIEYYHVQSGGGTLAKAGWQPPGAMKFVLIPEEAFVREITSDLVALERRSVPHNEEARPLD